MPLTNATNGIKPLVFIVSFLISPSFALAHGGGLDKNGGHYNKKSNDYHCHQEPCITNQTKTLEATVEAIKLNRPFSSIYQRDEWRHWSDFDSDCMNTRHEALKDRAVGPIKLSPDGCYVSTGLWLDPYSGNKFTRASDLDVDHVVPLKWANDHGGYSWTPEEKEVFANDPLNLLVVDDGLNQAKGAKGPNEWLPPNHTYRCEYIFLWQKVLQRYSDLTFTESEHRIFNKLGSACAR